MIDDIQNSPELNDVTTSSASHNAELELASCKEQVLRVSADFQNYRKRTEKERVDWAITAQASIINKLLPVIEDLDRALGAASQAGNAAGSEGLVLVQKNLKKALAEVGVEEIDCAGAFDPEFHEALTQVEKPEVESGKIAEVYALGYRFKGTVLRHAKVAVAK